MIRKVRKRKTTAGERTGFGLALEKSAQEILAHVKGNKTLRARRVVLPDRVDATTRAYLAVIAKNRGAALKALES
jgi:hypothetical protein